MIGDLDWEEYKEILVRGFLVVYKIDHQGNGFFNLLPYMSFKAY